MFVFLPRAPLDLVFSGVFMPIFGFSCSCSHCVLLISGVSRDPLACAFKESSVPGFFVRCLLSFPHVTLYSLWFLLLKVFLSNLLVSVLPLMCDTNDVV